jgi:hypothetical protein
VKSLTWDQVNAWRLARHGLVPRVGFMEAVRRMIGVQAQVMSAAELSLCARVDGLHPSDVQTALWQERTLVKTWAMRGTLFLFVAEDLPLVVATRQIRKARYWVKHFESYGIYEPQYQALLEAIPQVLGDEPMTREQLAVAAAEHTGIHGLLPALTESSWGTALKPSAFKGDLCYGPTQSRNVAFVRLLPMFDAYTHGLIDYDQLLPAAFRPLVFRPQGWISAVVLVDGRIGGVWEHKTRASGTTVKVHMFTTPDVRIRDAIVAEAERLNDFLDTRVAVEFDAA